jgi:hypothetical protein
VETDTERASRIAERLKNDPKIAQIVADARLFDSLRQEPGWRRLYEHVTAKKSRWMGQLSERMMGRKERWPTPEEIAYYQGFYQGAVFVLAHPEHAEANLERAASMAWAMTYEEDQTKEDE